MIAKEVPDSWNEHECSSDAAVDSHIELLRQTLDDAPDERPLQTFLAGHPHLLSCLLPGGRGVWCWDRPRFGAELVPDFLLCTRNSAGVQWVMVELESPRQMPLTQAGRPTAKLNEAMGQIRDWRAWLRQNISYTHEQLELVGLSAEAPAVIVIGRREALNPTHAVKYRELSNDKTQVMTYDRLIESIRRGREMAGVHNG
jgi:hypothetical protein